MDALVIAAAEPGGSVPTSDPDDPDDLRALAGYARAVRIAAV